MVKAHLYDKMEIDMKANGNRMKYVDMELVIL